jgi:hypothetical protein
VGVGGVGLATLTGGEHPGSRRQLGWDVDDVLTVDEQPVSDVATDAVAPFDRPDPLGPLPAVGQHLGIAVPIGGEPAPSQDGLVAGHHLDRH